MRHLRVFWEALRTSLWFVPGLLVLATVALAQILIEVDHHLDITSLQRDWPRLFGASPSGARGMLGTIASSMINVAGVGFSITIVALTLASSQYTSRILRNFMRDRANQVVLGIFVGIFVYCIVVMRTIRGTDGSEFVPVTAVLFAVFLAFVGIGCLIFFIHHIAASIQAESIVRAATDETIATLDAQFPNRLDDDDGRTEGDGQAMHLPQSHLHWRPVPARQTGYIQTASESGLIDFAEANEGIVRMEHSIGDFVVADCTLASVSTAAALDEEKILALNDLFDIGRRRTMVQDAGYGIRQIVDVAIKALSPGVNDTTTAVTCVQHLTAILVHLSGRRLPSRYRTRDGRLRLIAATPTFASLLSESFDQIRQNGAGNVAILLALLDGLEVLAQRVHRDEDHSALARQRELLADLTARSIPDARDREEVQAALTRLSSALGLDQDDPDEQTDLRRPRATSSARLR